MSLADELLAEAKQPSPTAAWIADWLLTIDDADKATFEAWVADSRSSCESMFRALQRRGYPCGVEALRRWVKQQRSGAS